MKKMYDMGKVAEILGDMMRRTIPLKEVPQVLRGFKNFPAKVARVYHARGYRMVRVQA